MACQNTFVGKFQPDSKCHKSDGSELAKQFFCHTEPSRWDETRLHVATHVPRIVCPAAADIQAARSRHHIGARLYGWCRATSAATSAIAVVGPSYLTGSWNATHIQ